MLKESPLFVKTFDFLKWVLGRTEKFPKSQRFFLAKRINDALFDFYEQIGEAVRIARHERQCLREADVRLMRLKHYFRLALELRYISLDQYKYATLALQELGRLLGSWIKKAGQPARGRDDAERRVEQQPPEPALRQP